MLAQYIAAAMLKAKYKILVEDGTYYGEIPGIEGIWANTPSLEACREELHQNATAEVGAPRFPTCLPSYKVG